MSKATESEPGRRERLLWRLSWALCLSFALVVIWSNRYLPMVDLPQHAALTSVWKHIDDPTSGYRQTYGLNYLTPYLLPFLVLRLSAEFLPILTATKVVLTFSLLAVPFACDYLVRRRGPDRWWCLLCFAFLFENAFYWGFIIFLFAVPVGLFTLAVGLDYLEKPGTGKGVWLGILCAALFFSHVIVFAIIIPMLAASAVLSRTGWKAILRGLFPLLASLLIALYWKSSFSSEHGSFTDFVVDADLTFKRFIIPGALLGRPRDVYSALAVVAFFAILLALARPRPKPGLLPWAPFLVTLVFVLLFPQTISRVYLGDRYSVFLLPTAMLGFVRSESRRAVRISRVVIVGSTLVWLAVLQGRFQEFNRRVGPFDQVIAQLQPHRRLVYLNYANEIGGTPPGNQLMHFGAWYQAIRVGRIGYSFAETIHQVVYFRPGASLIQDGKYLSWNPSYFDWRRHGDFDYFLLHVRGPSDVNAFLSEAAAHTRLAYHAGPWFLFERNPPAAPIREAAP